MSILSSTCPRILILGGGYAGLTVAQRLGRRRADAEITLVDARPAFEERIRLHQVVAGQSACDFSYQDFLVPLGVKFLQGRVVAIDPDLRQVRIDSDGGAVLSQHYDYLVYALGSFMDVNAVPGVREHAVAFDSVAAARALNVRLARTDGLRVMVVGGGLTGIETAAELAESLPGLKLRLAMTEPWHARKVAGGYAEETVRYLNQACERRGIELLTGARVSALEPGKAWLGHDRAVDFDICIWTSGFRPSALAEDAGLQVNAQGQIMVDASLCSLSHPDIIAIGDAASASTGDAGACRMGSATALAMGSAGANTVLALMAGKKPPAFRFVYLFRNICLGRDDGVVQFVDRRDIPRNTVWTGVKAAAWKEYVCQVTLSTIGLHEARRVPAMPPMGMLPQLLRGARQYA